jgi:hypothetical protein
MVPIASRRSSPRSRMSVVLNAKELEALAVLGEPPPKPLVPLVSPLDRGADGRESHIRMNRLEPGLEVAPIERRDLGLKHFRVLWHQPRSIAPLTVSPAGPEVMLTSRPMWLFRAAAQLTLRFHARARAATAEVNRMGDWPPSACGRRSFAAASLPAGRQRSSARRWPPPPKPGSSLRRRRPMSPRRWSR